VGVDDPWAAIDATQTEDVRRRDREAAAAVVAAPVVHSDHTTLASPPSAMPPATPPDKDTDTAQITVPFLLEQLGLLGFWPKLQAEGLQEVSQLRTLQLENTLAPRLTACGLKMGQRQKFILALGPS